MLLPRLPRHTRFFAAMATTALPLSLIRQPLPPCLFFQRGVTLFNIGSLQHVARRNYQRRSCDVAVAVFC